MSTFSRPPVEVLATWGVSPETNYPDDLDIRLSKLERVLQVHRPSHLVFVGGEKWEQGSLVTTEAEYIQHEARKRFEQFLPTSTAIIPEGLETIDQTKALIDWLRHKQLINRRIGALSSWHQLLRIGVVFRAEDLRRPIMLPVWNVRSTRNIAYDIIVNAFLGFGYTKLATILSRHEICNHGGPVIRRIREERQRQTSNKLGTTI